MDKKTLEEELLITKALIRFVLFLRNVFIILAYTNACWTAIYFKEISNNVVLINSLVCIALFFLMIFTNSMAEEGKDSKRKLIEKINE